MIQNYWAKNMPGIEQQQPVFRFGVFEINPHTRELRKHGVKLKLQDQPFQILLLLLEHPGEIVTREEIQKRLWPENTYVDFDNAINSAVRKLRDALGDSPENPHFVETLARRGYRFIAPVNGKTGPVAARALPSELESVKARMGWVLPITCLLIGLTIFAVWFWHRPRPGQSVLVQLTNDTGLTMDPAVSSDGKLLAYASDAGDDRNLNIWVQQLGEGGSAVQLTHSDADTSQPSFSPDGSKIVFSSAQNGGGIYIIPTLGGEPVRVAAYGRDPSFSPDGKWIAYWRGGYDSPFFTYMQRATSYVLPTEGGQERRIGSELKLGAARPVWAADSKRLLVVGGPENSSDLWVIYLDGKRPLRTGIFGVLNKQGFQFFFDRVPHVSKWERGFILFSARYKDAYNAWRLPISDEGRTTGPAERLTSGTTLEVSPVLTPNGSLIFASLNVLHSVWGVSGDTDHALVKGDLKKVTEGRFEVMPSISRDGRTLAFAARKQGAMARRPRQTDKPLMFPSAQHPFSLEIRAKDVHTGREARISRGEPFPPRSEISSDGSMLAYMADAAIYIARVDRSSPPTALRADKPLFVWDWSPDNKRLLFMKTTELAGIFSVDVASGRESLFLSRAGYGLYQTKYSPDAHAVAVMGCDDLQGCRIFIVPLNNDGTPQADNWIAIDHPNSWDDKPRWSPDGNLLYFVSDRDGHLCLWAQRLDGSSKRPIGTPFPVYHFHNSRLAMINVGVMALETGVARDKIVMGLGELTGNIWSLKR
jgi:Tol biopolymer transport system component/DNA-binding winged helix-turn-helix (wHTH) protein